MPETKEAPKALDIPHKPAKEVTLKEYREIESDYLVKIAKAETLHEYNDFVAFYTTFEKEAAEAHKDFKIEMVKISTFDELKTMEKKIEEEIHFSVDRCNSAEEVETTLNTILDKMSVTKNVMEFAEYEALYEEIVTDVTKAHADWKFSHPEVPNFFELQEAEKNAKMIEFKEETLTSEQSLELITKYLREIYTAESYEEYISMIHQMEKFEAIVLKKFPALASELPKSESLIEYTEISAILTDPAVKKPVVPNAEEIKKMTKEQITTAILKIEEEMKTVNNVVVYEMYADAVVHFSEDATKAHPEFKMEVVELPSYQVVMK